MKRYLFCFLLFSSLSAFALEEVNTSLPHFQSETQETSSYHKRNEGLDGENTLGALVQEENAFFTKTLNFPFEQSGDFQKQLSQLASDMRLLTQKIDTLLEMGSGLETHSTTILDDSGALNNREDISLLEEKFTLLGHQLNQLETHLNSLYIFIIVCFILFILFSWALSQRVLKHIYPLHDHMNDFHHCMKSDLEGQGLEYQSLDESINQPLEVDHSFFLKVADELVRIQKNLSGLDPSIKGLKQLKGSMERIRDNLLSSGYEVVDMLGQPYHEGMKVSATFIPNEELEAEQQVITRIIKPQVNYKNEMIQAAQIEVSVGESFN